MSQQSVKALNFRVDQVGKHVAASKKRYQWTISLKGKVHTITLDYSFISGKVKVVVDKKTLLENELPPNVSFQYPFTLDGFSLNCIQQGQNFELRVNNKVFSHLYNQEKTNSEFRKYEDEIRDIKTDSAKLTGSGKAIKISIGGMDTKKKTHKIESENWGDLGGEAFPNYFQDSAESGFSTDKSEDTKPVTNNKNLLDDEQSNQPKTSSVSEAKQEQILQFEKAVVNRVSANNNSFDNFFNFDQSNSSAPVSVSSSQEQNSNLIMSGATAFSKSKESDSGMDILGNVEPIPVSVVPAQNDFNTMQQMFSTMNVSQPQQPIQNQVNFFQEQKPVPLPIVQPVQSQANFFQEQKPVPPPLVQPTNTNVNHSVINTNMNDFNTMQNMFMTNQQNVPPMNMAPQQQISLNPNPNPPQLNNVNLNDFNTMQNLFQTQSPVDSGLPKPMHEKLNLNNSDDIFKSMGLEVKTKEELQGHDQGMDMFNTVANPININVEKKPSGSDFI